MELRVKERLTGAIVLVAIVVLVFPFRTEPARVEKQGGFAAGQAVAQGLDDRVAVARVLVDDEDPQNPFRGPGP